MKHWNNMTKAYRYLAASLVVVIGLVTLVGSSSSWEGGVAPVYAAFTAQPRRGLMPLEVFFDASESSGEIVVYAWDFGDGGHGWGITPTHTYINPGTYIVRLHVQSPPDPWGTAHHDYAYLDITVEGSVNAAFTAQPTSGPPPLEVSFDASASSSQDGTIVSYEWDFDDGQRDVGITTTHIYTDPGWYNPRLTVTEDTGARHSAVQTIGVGIPTATFTAQPTSGPPPLEVNFDASASSGQGGTIISYDWGFGDGQLGEGITTTHIYTDPGVYIPRLTVTNDFGLTDNLGGKCKPIIEVGIPTAVFSAQPTTGQPPLEVTFDASGSFSVYGSIVSYQWNFGDVVAGEGVSTTHTFTTPGSYLVYLTVWNDVGETDEARQVIKVGTGMPTAAFTAQPTSGPAPLEVLFDASPSSDPDGSIIDYYWSFCDWQWNAGVTTSYVYTIPGTYTTTLEVYDNQGYRDLVTQVITVEAN